MIAAARLQLALLRQEYGRLRFADPEAASVTWANVRALELVIAELEAGQ